MTEQQDKCPKCGAARNRQFNSLTIWMCGSDWMCGSSINRVTGDLERTRTCLEGELATLHAANESLEMENAKLREVVERLPKYADTGEPIQHGGGAFLVDYDGETREVVGEMMFSDEAGTYGLEDFDMFSTPEAAEAAQAPRVEGVRRFFWIDAPDATTEQVAAAMQALDEKAAEASTTKPGPDWFFGADYKGDAILDLQNHGAQASERKEGE
jgi:hypothetical protein